MLLYQISKKFLITSVSTFFKKKGGGTDLYYMEIYVDDMTVDRTRLKSKKYKGQ